MRSCKNEKKKLSRKYNGEKGIEGERWAQRNGRPHSGRSRQVAVSVE
jgi:hypothetical protein